MSTVLRLYTKKRGGTKLLVMILLDNLIISGNVLMG